jgi:hypothetical protein
VHACVYVCDEKFLLYNFLHQEKAYMAEMK